MKAQLNQNMWNAAKSVLRGKLHAYIRKEEKSKVSNLKFSVKKLEKENGLSLWSSG